MNLQLLSNYWIPEVLWKDRAFLASIGASGGEFPVRIWRHRGGSNGSGNELVDTIRVPAIYGAFRQYPISPALFESGDVAIIEFTPGLFVAPSADGRIPIAVPFGSEIDNRSNDPETIYPALVRFRQ